MSKYQWQGEPVKVEHGYCMVKTNKDKPLWWYNYECRKNGSAAIFALKVTTKDGYSFIISNEYGIGSHKLKNGGWPSYRHFSLDGTFHTNMKSKQTTLDLEGFQQHEAEREKWFKENYPIEYEEIDALKRIVTRSNYRQKQTP